MAQAVESQSENAPERAGGRGRVQSGDRRPAGREHDPLIARARRLETILVSLRYITAAVVLAMTVAFDSASDAAAALVVIGTLALNVYVSRALRGIEQAIQADELGRIVLACDVLLALSTYLLFLGDPSAMPIAFLPLLAFELAVRYDAAGIVIGLALFGVGLAGRIYAQLVVIEDGAVRAPMLLVWSAVVILMVAFSREFRSRENAERAAARERERIAAGFRATIGEILERADVASDETTRRDVTQAMQEICSGRRDGCEALAARIAELVSVPYADLGLTRREREIATMLGRGYPYARIAGELFISPSTVRNHVHNIKTKLGVSSREELVETVRRHR